jgi:hypothetical protein
VSAVLIDGLPLPNLSMAHLSPRLPPPLVKERTCLNGVVSNNGFPCKIGFPPGPGKSMGKPINYGLVLIEICFSGKPVRPTPRPT